MPKDDFGHVTHWLFVHFFLVKIILLYMTYVE